MKFPKQLRKLPISSGRSDEEIRRRIASLPEPEDVPEMKITPKRALTVPSRRIVSPGTGPSTTTTTTAAENLEPFESVRYEETVEAVWTEGNRDLPKRSKSVSYASPKPSTKGQSPDTSTSKTPKKSSPAFSLNRKSLREPLAFVKQQGKNYLRRGSVKDLFQTSPEKKIEVLTEKSTDVDHDNSTKGLKNPSKVDKNFADQVRLHHQPPVVNEHIQVNNTTNPWPERTSSREHSLTSQTSPPEIHWPKRISSKEYNNTTSSQTSPAVQAWPSRTSSREHSAVVSSHALRDTNDEQAGSLPRRRGVVHPNLVLPVITSGEEPHLLSVIRELRQMVADDEANETPQSAKVTSQVVTETAPFKSNSKNLFPPWVYGIRKPNGGIYSQKEIIELVSPGS